jgi:hypothetical protein
VLCDRQGSIVILVICRNRIGFNNVADLRGMVGESCCDVECSRGDTSD